ncbi:MAG: hypothetical protein MRJ65_11075 [Candidatus Brocadiaceae bacterium]|nr:hypothetical protein [Candidatus Brocadiaceae bacterium]
MPGENNDTIRKSIDFFKSLNLDFKQYQWTYALPIPGSHLYEYAIKTGMIRDEDKYLSSLTGKFAEAGTFHINLTDEPDDVVAGWGEKIKKELDGHYLKRRYKFSFIAKLMQLFMKIKLHYKKHDLWTMIFKRTKSMLFHNKRVIDTLKKKPARLKKKNSVIEGYFKDIDASSMNRQMSIKKINLRLQGKKEVIE